MGGQDGDWETNTALCLSPSLRPVFSRCFRTFVMYKTLPIKVLFCQISMLSDIAHHVLCCSTNCGGESGNQVVRT